MYSLQWLKIELKIFSNRKIQILLREPDGDTYFRVWIQLLIIAVECNRNGKLVIGNNKPMTIENFSKIMGKSKKKIEKIIQKFLELNMLIVEDEAYKIKNWDKYQSIEPYEKYKEQNIKSKEYNNKLLNRCNKLLCDIDNWPIIAIIFSIPLIAILVCILVLFGQRPDEAIKAFLETSDWTLSTKVSPPSITYDGHYLCTVSLKGHKNIVKPIRMGIRRGEKIVVNRQLCVANAFEDLIQERIPKFHHFVRYIYDKYGYPLSKHINTAFQTDITYILMKPLEWIFLLVIYIFDEKPENRIATQYIGKNHIK